jgi:rhamnogalacturonan endolyase
VGDTADKFWADARRRAAAERVAWPRAWLAGDPDYPLGGGRGVVSGRLVVEDPLKPGLDPAGGWVGLAQPEPGGNWQFDSKGYQYWSKIAPDGSFRVPHVRPGTHSLYAFIRGAHGEFELPGVTVAAGGTTNLGELRWQVPRHGKRLAWEIGVPDRSAAEFRHGDSYFQSYGWERFARVFPNPLVYEIGRSDPARDWNYAHAGYPRGGGRERWPWVIRFRLGEAPVGPARMTLGIASADYSRIEVFVNQQPGDRPLATVRPRVSGGNALLRQAVHAKYGFEHVEIPAGRLKAGENTITLVQGHVSSAGAHVMYDAVTLELP